MGVVYSDVPKGFKDKVARELTLDFAKSSQISEHVNEGFGGEGCAKTAPQGARTARDLAGDLLGVD